MGCLIAEERNDRSNRPIEMRSTTNIGKNQSTHQSITMSKPLTYLLIFLLGYSLGFFSTPQSFCPRTISTIFNQQQQPSPPPPSAPPPPPPPTQNPKPPQDFYQFTTNCATPIPKDQIVPTLLKKIFNNTSPYLNFPPPHVRPLLQHNDLHGWGSTNSVFETLVNKARPNVIIEVGSFLGLSALHMANLTHSLNLTDTLILCLDDFRGWPGFRDTDGGIFNHLIEVNGDVILMQQFMQNVVDAGESGRVVPVPFATGAGLDALCQWGVFGDLIEVDAGHTFHSAWEDINRAWKILKPGGIMFGHDYPNVVDNYGVRRAVDLFAKEKGLRVQPDGEHWILFPLDS